MRRPASIAAFTSAGIVLSVITQPKKEPASYNSLPTGQVGSGGPMEIDISEKSWEGFNDHAKQEFKKATSKFAEDLLAEANRIEASQNEASNTPQVTSSMVSDASVMIRRGLVRPRKKIGTKILRVLAAVLPLIVGIAYDPVKLQDKSYMFAFVVLVAFAIFAVTWSVLQE